MKYAYKKDDVVIICTDDRKGHRVQLKRYDEWVYLWQEIIGIKDGDDHERMTRAFINFVKNKDGEYYEEGSRME